MNGHLDRAKLVNVVLREGLPAKQRRVLCACIGLASCEGLLTADVRVIAPMCGVRVLYVAEALEALERYGWLVPAGGTLFKLGTPAESTGRLSRALNVPPP